MTAKRSSSKSSNAPNTQLDWNHLLQPLDSLGRPSPKTTSIQNSSTPHESTMGANKKPTTGDDASLSEPLSPLVPSPLNPEDLQETSPSNPEAKVYSVSQINRAVKENLEGHFTHVWVRGEISNFKAHTSGHHYFSLKDEKNQISAVMFKSYNHRLNFLPETGMEVLVCGRITVYEPRGSYQVFCETMEPVGAGALQKAFEQLKERLNKEGLFDPSLKKQLPAHPKKVAVVTSPTGAAIRDILHVLKRRVRRVEITVVPVRVQGEQCGAEIAQAIEQVESLNSFFDVLIVTRGGGSSEDLWGFNDEQVARAIFSCSLPVISAVGHEIDFTISDFVADYRAPTPSAAGEIVAQSEKELLEKLNFHSHSLSFLIREKIKNLFKQTHLLSAHLTNPHSAIQESMIQCDDWNLRMIQSIKRYFKYQKIKISEATQGLSDPQLYLGKLQQKLDSLNQQIKWAIQHQMGNCRSQWLVLDPLLESLNPNNVVKRGYAIVRRGERVLDSSMEVQRGEELDIQLSKGRLRVEVKESKQC